MANQSGIYHGNTINKHSAQLKVYTRIKNEGVVSGAAVALTGPQVGDAHFLKTYLNLNAGDVHFVDSNIENHGYTELVKKAFPGAHPWYGDVEEFYREIALPRGLQISLAMMDTMGVYKSSILGPMYQALGEVAAPNMLLAMTLERARDPHVLGLVRGAVVLNDMKRVEHAVRAVRKDSGLHGLELLQVVNYVSTPANGRPGSPMMVILLKNGKAREAPSFDVVGAYHPYRPSLVDRFLAQV